MKGRVPMFIHARKTSKGYVGFTTNTLHAILFRCDTLLCMSTGNRLAFKTDDGWAITYHGNDNPHVAEHIKRLIAEAQADTDYMD